MGGHMRIRRRMLWIVAGTMVAAAVLGLHAPSAGATPRAVKCPSGGTPPPGTTINGGLEIDGFCVLDGVTVHNGVFVDPSPDSPTLGNWNLVDLSGSTVHGGVFVSQGSELDTSIDESTFSVTPESATIEGGITLDRSVFGILAKATVRGGITADGITEPPAFVLTGICGDENDPPCWNNDAYCGLTVYGDVVERNLDFTQAFLGDPGEEGFFANSDCRPTTIYGSVFLTNSNFTRPTDGEPSEIEGNAISGSVHIEHSTAEVSSNTIGGSLLCTDGSIIHPPPPVPPDVAGNSVRGRDTCD